MRETLRDIIRTVNRALRLITFQNVDRYQPDPTMGCVGLMLAAELGSIALMDAASAGSDLEFSVTGLAIVAAGQAILIGWLWLSQPSEARFGLGRVVADCAAVSAFFALPLTALLVLAKDTAGPTDEAVTTSGLSLSDNATVAVIVWAFIVLLRIGYQTWTGSSWRFGYRPLAFALTVALLSPSTPIV